MKRLRGDGVVGCILVIIFAAMNAGSAWGATDPTEASFIEAWERSLKSHPKTVVFERLERGVYRFHTTRFPFDGKLRVLNISIEPMQDFGYGEYAIGVAEVELEGLDDEFIRKYSHSYSLWQQDNMLYYWPRLGGWIGANEYQQEMTRGVGQASGWCVVDWSGYFWLGLLVVVAIVLAMVYRMANRQMKTAMAAHEKALAEQQRAMQMTERALQLSEDSNRLLREILEEVKALGS